MEPEIVCLYVFVWYLIAFFANMYIASFALMGRKGFPVWARVVLIWGLGPFLPFLIAVFSPYPGRALSLKDGRLR